MYCMFLELDFLYTINCAKIPSAVNRLLHKDFSIKNNVWQCENGLLIKYSQVHIALPLYNSFEVHSKQNRYLMNTV